MRALLLCILTVLSLPALADAQAPDTTITAVRIAEYSAGPSELRLTGPATADIGEPVVLVVRGLPAVDLSRTVGEQTQWIQTLRFECSAPSGVTLEIDKELSMSVSPWEWRLRLTFTPPEGGIYVVVCDWNESPFGLALHRVEVGPNVPPPPPPPPPPTSKSALILLEKSVQGEALAMQLNLFRNYPVSNRVEVMYLPSEDEKGNPPALLVDVLAHLQGKPLPRLVFLSSAGAPTDNIPLPASAAVIVAELAKRGIQ